jgi:hypothetical protein
MAQGVYNPSSQCRHLPVLFSLRCEKSLLRLLFFVQLLDKVYLSSCQIIQELDFRNLYSKNLTLIVIIVTH